MDSFCDKICESFEDSSEGQIYDNYINTPQPFKNSPSTSSTTQQNIINQNYGHGNIPSFPVHYQVGEQTYSKTTTYNDRRMSKYNWSVKPYTPIGKLNGMWEKMIIYAFSSILYEKKTSHGLVYLEKYSGVCFKYFSYQKFWIEYWPQTHNSLSFYTYSHF